MAAGSRASAGAATTNIEVVTGMTSKPPVFSGNHGDDWTIWEIKMTAHLNIKHYLINHLLSTLILGGRCFVFLFR
jgi:hypothetical protein